MRRLLTVAGLLVATATASAQTLYVTEPFSGLTTGQSLSGQGSGLNWNGNWSTASGSSATVQTGSLVSPTGTLQTSGDSVTTSVTTQNVRTVSNTAVTGNTSDYWVSFLINTTATSAGQYAGISIGGSVSTGGGVFIGKPSGTGGNWGTDVTGGSSAVSSGAPVSSGTTTLLVAHLTTSGTTLYVNPTPGLANPNVSGSLNSAATSSAINGTIVQLFNGSSGVIPTSAFDELRIGDSFAAVTPVPEPTAIGLLASAGLGLAGFARRRFC